MVTGPPSTPQGPWAPLLAAEAWALEPASHWAWPQQAVGPEPLPAHACCPVPRAWAGAMGRQAHLIPESPASPSHGSPRLVPTLP